MINVFIIALICAAVVALGLMVVKLVMQNEIVNIRNTKYFIPTICINLGVYLIAVFGFGNYFSENVFLNITECVMKAISASVLSIDIDIIGPAVAESALFEVAFVLSYIVTAFTLVFVALGLMGRFLSNSIKVRRILWSKGEKIVIFGFNEDAKNFAKTIKSKKVLFWVAGVDKEFKKELMAKKYLNLMFDSISPETFKKFAKKRVNFVSFETDNVKILKLIDTYIAAGNKLHNLYVSIDSEHEDAFKFNYGDENLNFFNSYSLVSQKFITDFPMTKFLTDKQIDSKTATVKENVSLNTFMFGFGKHNKGLLDNLIIGNQFPTLKGGKPALKSVHYHVFDRKEYTSKDFVSNLSKCFKKDLDKSKYFPLPDKPMTLEYHQNDFFAQDFFEDFDKILDKIKIENSLNYVIVSFGSDLDNIDVVIRIKQYFMQRGIEEHFKFFCRVYKDSYTGLLSEAGITAYGEFEIMDYDTIVREKLNRLSIEHNFQKAIKRQDVVEAYEEIKKIRSITKQEEELDKLKINLWNELDFYNKDYDSFANINVRTKLNLLGLDTEGEEEITNKEFYKLYDPFGEMIVENRQKIYKYPYPKSHSPRNMLAYQELLHSNAFWFVKGFVPMENDVIVRRPMEIINAKRKQLATLTTFDGLDQIIDARMQATEKQKLKIDDEELDLKKDLYQVMDNTPLYKYSVYMIYRKK